MEILPCAVENGIGLTPWSPLGGGWLTGKYQAPVRPTGATRLGEDPDRGVEAYDRCNNEHTHAVLRVTGEIAQRHGRPMSHVALAWLASRPGVASILIGARNQAQMAENLDAMDLELSREDLDTLTRVSMPALPDYPYAFLRDWSGLEHWDRLGTR
ncbi:MAG: aldo/keto reductase [Paracoccus sp. (in: a-proteobacteria)]